jgi:glycosyltransferase involved in cell wall biosynthesis
MKVLVVNNMAPFIRGGAEELADHLVANLRRTKGVEAELLRIPFSWMPYERVADEIMLCRMMETYWVDRIIALKFPAYLIPHEHKTLWLLHQYRQAYDLFDSRQSNIPDDRRGHAIRNLVKNADNGCFGALNREIFVNSATTRDRLKRYNGFASTILPPPLNDPQSFANLATGDYIFAGGRVNSHKRQHLLVEAMKFSRSGVRLIVGGPPDTPGDAERLRRAVAEANLEDRVVLDLGFLARAKLAAYVNNALACVYLPFDEDSVGYVTMEAFQAQKAVITSTDAGGVLEIVHNGVTGLVADPTPRALAEAMDRLFLNRQRAEKYGRAGHDLWAAKNITWPSTVERLLS